MNRNASFERSVFRFDSGDRRRSDFGPDRRWHLSENARQLSAAIGSPRTRTSPMTKTQDKVITSVQRRRRWSRPEKERIVAATTAVKARPGAGVPVAIVPEGGQYRSLCLRTVPRLLRATVTALIKAVVKGQRR